MSAFLIACAFAVWLLTAFAWGYALERRRWARHFDELNQWWRPAAPDEHGVIGDVLSSHYRETARIVGAELAGWPAEEVEP